MTSGRAGQEAAPLELVYSPCPNDTFVFHAWSHGLLAGAPDVLVRHADVDEANDLAARGIPDVVKVSYAALPYLLGDYRLLRAGGALGRGCGPLVLTAGPSVPGDGPAGGLAGARVAVPGERTTAYLLFRLWAAEQRADPTDAPPDVHVVPFPEIMPAVRAGRYDLGLVIHEARFTYAGYGLRCLVDLGSWWEKRTGLPIPLGAILARRSLDQQEITEAIRASVEHAWSSPAASAQYVRSLAQELDPEVVAAHIGLYVNASTRQLSAADEAAVRELLAASARAGLVPPVSPGALD